MKCNKWTMALAAAGVVSLGSVVQAEEAQHQVLTALSSTTLSGYVDTSAIWKPGTDQGGGRLPGHVFDGADKMDGFNLQAIKLTLEKPLDEGQWSAGYKTDLIFGPDANYYQTLLNGGSSTAVDRDFAIKQAYVALRAPVGNGIDIKVGVFDTIIGYEVFESGNNPNYSRSFGYALEPTQHTGILASYHVTDWLSVAGGVADTSFGAINARAARGAMPAAESMKTYMGSVTLTLPDATGPLAGSVVYLGVVNGLGGATVFGTTNLEDEKTSSYYAGATIKTPLTGLSVGAAFDYRTDFMGSSFPGGLAQENKAYSVAGYLTYAVTEKLRINDRIDYANADAGTFYAISEPGVTPGNREHLLSNTFTVDYSLWDNVITRAEFRWDHSLNGDRPYGGDLNPMRNAYILAANIIYKF
jgi:hypothetical protein